MQITCAYTRVLQAFNNSWKEFCMRMYLEAFGMARDVEMVDGDLGVLSYELTAVRTGGHTHSTEKGGRGGMTKLCS